jgi:hypothetical protein
MTSPFFLQGMSAYPGAVQACGRSARTGAKFAAKLICAFNSVNDGYLEQGQVDNDRSTGRAVLALDRS